MDCNNQATRLRREILTRLAGAAFAGELEETVDRVPYAMRPREVESSRCCVYKDRAVLRYRCMAAMGFAVEDETDDFTPLHDYAARATARATEGAAPEGPVMTVLDVACQGCVTSRYLSTEACQGCLARPCVTNCPFEAIQVVEGRARIDSHKCINCGKCREVCPYKAITRVPVPCEEACPVGAIRKDATGKARIDEAACVSCGHCMRACPFGAVMEKSQILDVVGALRGDRPTVALVAPAMAGQFPGTMEQIAAALTRLGFDEVVEVAHGAEVTTREEAVEFLERVAAGADFMTTSCCPAYRETVRKHVPELAPKVSHTKTPMQYTAAWVKERWRAERGVEARTVFLGPCVAKRKEGMDDPAVDYVLTFEEVGALLATRGIEVAVCEEMPLATNASPEARGFPVSGGVAGAVAAYVAGATTLRAACVNGLNAEGVQRLRDYAAGLEAGMVGPGIPPTLVEVMACEGGCVGGAGTLCGARQAAEAIGAWRRAEAEGVEALGEEWEAYTGPATLAAPVAPAGPAAFAASDGPMQGADSKARAEGEATPGTAPPCFEDLEWLACECHA